MVLLFALAWCMLWYGRPLSVSYIVLLALPCAIPLVHWRIFPQIQVLLREGYLPALILLPIVGVVWSGWTAWKRRQASLKRVVGVALAWAFLVVVFMGADLLNQAAVLSLSTGAAVTAWIVAPFVTLPQAIHRGRHQ